MAKHGTSTTEGKQGGREGREGTPGLRREKSEIKPAQLDNCIVAVGFWLICRFVERWAVVWCAVRREGGHCNGVCRLAQRPEAPQVIYNIMAIQSRVLSCIIHSCVLNCIIQSLFRAPLSPKVWYCSSWSSVCAFFVLFALPPSSLPGRSIFLPPVLLLFRLLTSVLV